MPTGSLGITIPLERPLAVHQEPLRRLWAAGYRHFWSSETAAYDAFTPLAYAAAVLPEAQFGTAIAGVFQRGPALLAMSAAALADAAPGRFTLGVGAASPAIVTQWNGIPYTEPRQRVADTVTFLRAALAGERTDSAPLGVAGFRLERPPDVPPPILVAALRPAMLRLAGKTDGAVLNWLSAADVATVLPHVGAGKQIAARLFVCPTDDPAPVRAAARRLVTAYLTVPGYAAFHRWLGRGDRLAPMWDAWARGDRKAALAAVGDDVVDELFIIGTPPECAVRVADYLTAGIDIPLLKFLPLDPSRDELADAVAVAEAMP
jgi:probable F420-dependent oxidoreductase